MLFNLVFLVIGILPTQEIGTCDLIEINEVWLPINEQQYEYRFVQVLFIDFHEKSPDKIAVRYFKIYGNKKDVPPINKEAAKFVFRFSNYDTDYTIESRYFRRTKTYYDKELTNREYWGDDYRESRNLNLLPKRTKNSVGQKTK